MSTLQLFQKRLEASLAVVGSLRHQLAELAQIAEGVVGVLRAEGTLYTAGNGGSAAQALHLAEELIGRYRGDRRPLRAVCLNADPTALTCIANDFGFDQVFARQCQALLKPNDAVLVMSTSGRSANVVNALKAARTAGVVSYGFLGGDGGPCRELCDRSIVIGPAADSAAIQEAHQVALHLICEKVEQSFGTR